MKYYQEGYNFKYKICVVCKEKFPVKMPGKLRRSHWNRLRPMRSRTCSRKCSRIRWNARNRSDYK